MKKKHRWKKPKRTTGLIHANIPINRMSETAEETRDTLPQFAAEAWSKEFEIKTAEGPHSIPERWYPQSLKPLPGPEDEE